MSVDCPACKAGAAPSGLPLRWGVTCTIAATTTTSFTATSAAPTTYQRVTLTLRRVPETELRDHRAVHYGRAS